MVRERYGLKGKSVGKQVLNEKVQQCEIWTRRNYKMMKFYHYYFRLTEAQFNYLLQKMVNGSLKNNTCLRADGLPEERLAVCQSLVQSNTKPPGTPPPESSNQSWFLYFPAMLLIVTAWRLRAWETVRSRVVIPHAHSPSTSPIVLLQPPFVSLSFLLLCLLFILYMHCGCCELLPVAAHSRKC